MLALRMIGYVAIALSVVGVVISFSEGWLYFIPTLTLLVPGIELLAFDAVVVEVKKNRKVLTPTPENRSTTRLDSGDDNESVVAEVNGIKLRQDGGKLVVRRITFDSIAEFESWAQRQ